MFRCRNTPSARARCIDFATINAAALPRLPELLTQLLPGGRARGAEFEVGSLRGEPGRSLHVRVHGARAGAWIDFATGEKGGDVIALAAAVWRVSQGEAARRLVALLGVEACRHG
jgi:hypothetical protein